MKCYPAQWQRNTERGSREGGGVVLVVSPALSVLILYNSKGVRASNLTVSNFNMIVEDNNDNTFCAHGGLTCVYFGHP